MKKIKQVNNMQITLKTMDPFLQLYGDEKRKELVAAGILDDQGVFVTKHGEKAIYAVILEHYYDDLLKYGQSS